MSNRLAEVWVYLAASPLLGLTATLLAYQFAYALYTRAKFSPLANPVAISVALLVIVLLATGVSYQTYFAGAQFVHFLLGPATVALALPLYQQLDKLRRQWRAFLAGALLGSASAIVSAMLIAKALGASQVTVLSLAAKSVTMAIAMGITEKIGGLPSLTAALVMLTGILGAMMAASILDRLHIRDASVRGFALGVAAHGIGTARAFQISDEMGAFAGLAMGLSGLLTALVLPVLLRVFAVI
ncbi:MULTISPECIES: LrgB family protein [unclassified Undibacterium]|uniref:LrgB family protein n=1 Tax=unclassified Undibacterium TaxID=2630295 RepID=UPI002AC97E52|nr:MULTISPECIES: LrgB family protein [unclassified Undibacterium]MEB0137946.1 LrgB family protein [Undibacterium sp. CCC2.1]MEB0172066.1 LrgB family protein [Undibacterium sp. CCC1.1]MEB0174954.1 LrgB family protein [Undibacterium sp. CCC3.4]MEB0214838.1 LrgB family protein [Undibacterium sp. 5I2]WPX45398.1 LrgB family protein [Undibacterium sp. CCC3.4]